MLAARATVTIQRAKPGSGETPADAAQGDDALAARARNGAAKGEG